MHKDRESWLVPRAEIFKALGHPSRLLIVETLRGKRCSVSELTQIVAADASTVSKHLSILRAAGIVQSERTGTTVFYSLACDCLSGMLSAAQSILEIKARNAADSL